MGTQGQAAGGSGSINHSPSSGEQSTTLNASKILPLCYDCGRDLDCFIKNNLQSLRSLSNPKMSKHKEYFLGQDHYFPWNWHCRSNNGIVMQYLRYDRSSKFVEQFAELLKAHKVDKEKIHKIILKMKSTVTVHKTFNSLAWKEALDLLGRREDLYKLLIKTYYYDYMETDFFPIYPTFHCWLKHNKEINASNYRSDDYES